MPKQSKKYLKVDPFKIIEENFHKDRDLVSESLFSLGNEYSGIRGFFDEGYSGNRLQGSYFNGIYEYDRNETPNAYKGIVKKSHFTINSVNYVKCLINVDGETLDLNNSIFSNFYRELDMKSGLYTRSFVWNVGSKKIKITFERLLNMECCHEAIQRIHFESNENVNLYLEMSLDSNVLHWGSYCYWKRENEYNINDNYGISVSTITTNQKLVSMMNIDRVPESIRKEDMNITACFNISLVANKEEIITRYVINNVDKFNKFSFDELVNKSNDELISLKEKGFNNSLNQNKKYFDKLWSNSDVVIDGDDEAQQGIRYCIFQLEQTYHGYEEDNNIGAKGLTGEAYSGHAFWDSETYCLPYYLFSNKNAAKNLLMFRYNTLKEAKERAIELDCEGACYPIATRNGKEACCLWQHASLQLQPSTAVFYAIYHYMNLYNDNEFMENYGLEMITEIAKFLLSRGQYNQDKTKFSFYGVMGPDEFQVMVNHNTYTNFMAKKIFDYLIGVINNNEYNYKKIFEKCSFDEEHIIKLKDASEKMIILYDKESNLFEQNEGFFDLPHVDINKIPESDFPLYKNWSYDRIYRNDMIKQPDVLMFMFLYSQDFSLEEKKANYEYYEPRCIHESSLSPSIHSIFACELHKNDEASKFFGFATRLDLDDYNNNTSEGIHTTSIAAAWMNIVYGFGGLRSDRSKLVLNPMIIDKWNYYSFNIKYRGSTLNVKVDKDNVYLKNTGNPIDLMIYGRSITVNGNITIKNENV